ncbi:MAG: zinc-ribbon domain-containing protein [Myxococcota bacterium]
MDVTCERCGTRYEFDEALVSARGTTVKCTSCGHQFKVFRKDGARELDGWTVHTTDGRELGFKAMRELQGAIATGTIQPDDVLIARSGGEPRRLGQIDELRSFFDERDDLSAPTQRRAAKKVESPYAEHKGTLLGGTGGSGGGEEEKRDTLRPRVSLPAPKIPGHAPARAPIDEPPSTKPHDRLLSESAAARVASSRTHRRNKTGTLETEAIPPAATSSTEVLDETVVYDDSQDELEIQTSYYVPGNRREGPSELGQTRLINEGTIDDDATIGDADSASHVAVQQQSVVARDSGPPPVTKTPVSSDPKPSSIEPLTPTPSAARPSVLNRSDVHSDPRFSGYGGRKRSAGIARLVVGVMTVGVLGTAGFQYLQKNQATPEPVAPVERAQDPKVERFLDEGEQRLAAGDVHGAQEQFVKASAVAENDPRVTQALARVAVTQADFEWLHLRLVPEKTPHYDAVNHQLQRAVQQVEKRVAAAARVSAKAPATTALRIDALRLQGKTQSARELVGELPPGASPPSANLSLALAALDLTEEAPDYASVVDRLRQAARGEEKLGRAQSMLVYALVRSQDPETARRELEALKQRNPQHPLLSVLGHFVDGTAPPEEAPPKEAAPAPSTQRPTAPPAAPAPIYRPAPTPDPVAAPPAEPTPGDGHIDTTDLPHIDTSDLPGAEPPPASPAPPEPPPAAPEPAPAPAPPPVDATDLPPVDTTDLP